MRRAAASLRAQDKSCMLRVKDKSLVGCREHPIPTFPTTLSALCCSQLAELTGFPSCQVAFQCGLPATPAIPSVLFACCNTHLSEQKKDVQHLLPVVHAGSHLDLVDPWDSPLVGHQLSSPQLTGHLGGAGEQGGQQEVAWMPLLPPGARCLVSPLWAALPVQPGDLPPPSFIWKHVLAS